MNHLRTYLQPGWESILKISLTESTIYLCLICLAVGHFLRIRIIITAFVTYTASVAYMINQRRVNSLKEHRLWSLIFKDFNWLDDKVNNGLQPILVANPALHEIFFLLCDKKDTPRSSRDQSIDSQTGADVPAVLGESEARFDGIYNSLNGRRTDGGVDVQDDIIKWKVLIPGITNKQRPYNHGWCSPEPWIVERSPVITSTRTRWMFPKFQTWMRNTHRPSCRAFSPLFAQLKPKWIEE